MVMKKLNELLSVIIMVAIGVFLTTCKRDDNPDRILDITGYAQKGPFINGSSVTVYDLKSDLSPTGKTYNTQITDNKGTFQIDNISLRSDYVNLRADGFYFNEVTGVQSTAQITLYALADISDKSNINVNILTHLEKARVEYLIRNGKSFIEAKEQAQSEILAIFNIEESTNHSSESLSIIEPGADNGILLAISAILQGYRLDSQLTSLLADISNDIKEDGVLDNEALGTSLVDQAILLDTASIKINLADRYEILGSSISIPGFGKYISNFISNTGFEITESPITYPDTCLYGDNILSLTKTEYTGGLETTHSLAAELPAGIDLKIRLTALDTARTVILGDTVTPLPTPLWGYEESSRTNWTITPFDEEKYSQMFTATESGKSSELKMYFEQGSFKIEYFEMNSVLPKRIKTIICN
jgi:hypothetical protein